MSSGETRACCNAALADSTARSVALKSFREPPKVPNGVRFAPRNQISSVFEMDFMCSPLTATKHGSSEDAQSARRPHQPVQVLLPDFTATRPGGPGLRCCQPALLGILPQGAHRLNPPQVGAVNPFRRKVLHRPREVHARDFPRWASVVRGYYLAVVGRHREVIEVGRSTCRQEKRGEHPL